MKITKKTKEDTTTYFYDGIKKYEHYKDYNGDESWREYDKNNNEIHYKNSAGFETFRKYDKNNNQIYFKDSFGLETWSNNNPKKPKKINKELKEENIKPFEFDN